MANRRRNSSASRLPHNDTSRSTAPDGSSDRHPVYHGIRLRDGKWVPGIYEPNKTTRVNLETYPTPEMAATAYDVAALALQGTKAVPNFTDSNSIISHMLPVDSTIKDICVEAARAAAARSPGYEYGSGSMAADGTNTGPPRIDYNPPENGSYYDSGGSGNLGDY